MFDVYVWVQTENRTDVLRRFINAHVDERDPREPPFDAFVRTFIDHEPLPGDP